MSPIAASLKQEVWFRKKRKKKPSPKGLIRCSPLQHRLEVLNHLEVLVGTQWQCWLASICDHEHTNPSHFYLCRVLHRHNNPRRLTITLTIPNDCGPNCGASRHLFLSLCPVQTSVSDASVKRELLFLRRSQTLTHREVRFALRGGGSLGGRTR